MEPTSNGGMADCSPSADKEDPLWRRRGQSLRIAATPPSVAPVYLQRGLMGTKPAQDSAPAEPADYIISPSLSRLSTSVASLSHTTTSSSGHQRRASLGTNFTLPDSPNDLKVEARRRALAGLTVGSPSSAGTPNAGFDLSVSVPPLSAPVQLPDPVSRMEVSSPPSSPVESDNTNTKAAAPTKTSNITALKASGAKPYQCSWCGKRFKRKSDCTKHIRIHTGDKPYQCGFCDSRFSDSSNMYKHERRYHGQSSCDSASSRRKTTTRMRKSSRARNSATSSRMGTNQTVRARSRGVKRPASAGARRTHTKPQSPSVRNQTKSSGNRRKPVKQVLRRIGSSEALVSPLDSMSSSGGGDRGLRRRSRLVIPGQLDLDDVGTPTPSGMGSLMSRSNPCSTSSAQPMPETTSPSSYSSSPRSLHNWVLHRSTSQSPTAAFGGNNGGGSGNIASANHSPAASSGSGGPSGASVSNNGLFMGPAMAMAATNASMQGGFQHTHLGMNHMRRADGKSTSLHVQQPQLSGSTHTPIPRVPVSSTNTAEATRQLLQQSLGIGVDTTPQWISPQQPDTGQNTNGDVYISGWTIHLNDDNHIL